MTRLADSSSESPLASQVLTRFDTEWALARHVENEKGWSRGVETFFKRAHMADDVSCRHRSFLRRLFERHWIYLFPLRSLS